MLLQRPGTGSQLLRTLAGLDIAIHRRAAQLKLLAWVELGKELAKLLTALILTSKRVFSAFSASSWAFLSTLACICSACACCASWPASPVQ